MSRKLIGVNHRDLISLLFSRSEVKASCRVLIMVTDSWTNIGLHGDSIMNFSICDPEPMFVASITVTAQFLADQIVEQMQAIGTGRISVLVTDNAVNMRSVCEKVASVAPEIVTLGCASHSLNLLLQDFLSTPSLQITLLSVKKIVKTVNNKGIVKAKFQGAETLKLQVITK